MLHVACVLYCNQDVLMAPQRWHEALHCIIIKRHHYQSSSPSWYLSVEKTVRCIVSRLCGWNHQPQAEDSAWKPKTSTSSTAYSPATSTSTSSLLIQIVVKCQTKILQTFCCCSRVFIHAMSLPLHACLTHKNFLLGLHYLTAAPLIIIITTTFTFLE